MRAPGPSRTSRFVLLLAGSVCTLGASLPVHAQALRGETRIVESEARTTTDKRDNEARAREWNLRAEDWSRYRTLMQGPLGTYSPNLDPLTALGIEARSDEERRRFAELQVQAEARRVQKTLDYQRAYDAAWQRLHPDLQRVALPGGQAGGDVRGGTGAAEPGRLAVFVKEGCVACDQRVQQLQSAGTAMAPVIPSGDGHSATCAQSCCGHRAEERRLSKAIRFRGGSAGRSFRPAPCLAGARHPNALPPETLPPHRAAPDRR